MKSQVIIFWVSLFCSKIVVSVPFSDDLRQRTYQQSSRPAIQNAPEQYHDPGFTRTRNENTEEYYTNPERQDYESPHKFAEERKQSSMPVIQNAPEQYYDTGFTQTQNRNVLKNIPLQNEYAQEYYKNSEKEDYENYKYNNNPQIPAREILANFGSSGHRLEPQISRDNYPPKENMYPIRTNEPQVRLDSQQYRNQNSQNEDWSRTDIRSVPSVIDIGDHEMPPGTTVQKPHHGSVQYVPIKYPERQNHQSDIPHQTRKSHQYPLDKSENNRYTVNSQSHPRSSGPISYASHDLLTDVNVGQSRDNRYVDSSIPLARSPNPGRFEMYNRVPTVPADTSPDAFNSFGEEEKHRFRSESNNPILINKYNSDSSSITVNEKENSRNQKYHDKYGSGLRTTYLAPGNTYSNPPTDTLARNAGNDKYGSEFTSSTYNMPPTVISVSLPRNLPPINTLNNAPPPVLMDTSRSHGNDKYVDRHGSDSKVPYFAPDNTYKNALVEITDVLERSSGNDKTSRSNKPVPVNTYKESSLTSTKTLTAANSRDTKREDNYRLGLDRVDDKNKNEQEQPGPHYNILKPQIIHNILKTNNKRYKIIHHNGTVENVDSLDSFTKNNPNYRLVYANTKTKNDTGSDEGYTTQSPVQALSSSSTTPTPGSTLPPSINLFGDDNSKSTPLIPSSNHKPALTTLQPIIPDTTTKPLILNKSKNNQTSPPGLNNHPVVITTPCPDVTTVDDIMTIPSMELETDNVTDAPSMTTTTDRGLSAKDTITYAHNKQDHAQNKTGYTDISIFDKSDKNSTTFTNISVTQIDKNSKDIVQIETKQKNSTKSHKKSTEDTEIKKAQNNSQLFQSAPYNLLTNTDVPAKSDDYSLVTTEPSVESDVNSGDKTSDDNPLEFEQSSSDITITLNETNKSEGEIIISIEVSENTDDANNATSDSSSDSETLEVIVNTNDDNDGDLKKINEDKPCKHKDKGQNIDDRNKENVQIDLSNFKDKPTMLISTNNEDLIDKLVNNQSSESPKVMYLFILKPQPMVEKEKNTTRYCNGTIVIETVVTTWQESNDGPPIVTRKKEIFEMDNYEP